MDLKLKKKLKCYCSGHTVFESKTYINMSPKNPNLRCSKIDYVLNISLRTEKAFFESKTTIWHRAYHDFEKTEETK